MNNRNLTRSKHVDYQFSCLKSDNKSIAQKIQSLLATIEKQKQLELITSIIVNPKKKDRNTLN